jgi:D-xylose 1-dehydrogenase (NADP+, D-xylono-1,5-lactone-forming)
MIGTTPVRFGILGAANIGRQFASGLHGSETAVVAAVASREADKATAFARELGIPRSLDSYEALLADPNIDAIYLPLPNDLHAEWAIRAAEARKHILCEKPLCMTAAEARAMFAAARAHGVCLAEAYPYMAQPQTIRLREWLREGAIGQVQTITAAFGFGILSSDGMPLHDPANIRLVPERGGGALRDAGTYAVSLVRLAAGERPSRVQATWRRAKTGVDQTVVANLDFPSGALAQISCSMSAAFHRYAMIVGDKGVIETNYANHAPGGAATLSLRIKRGVPGTVAFETVDVPASDGFRLEAESFARMVRLGPDHWSGASEAESIDTVITLEAITASAPIGGWVDLSA